MQSAIRFCKRLFIFWGWECLWLGRATVFVSHLQSQDCVGTLEFFFSANTEQTARGP